MRSSSSRMKIGGPLAAGRRGAISIPSYVSSRSRVSPVRQLLFEQRPLGPAAGRRTDGRPVRPDADRDRLELAGHHPPAQVRRDQSLVSTSRGMPLAKRLEQASLLVGPARAP